MNLLGEYYNRVPRLIVKVPVADLTLNQPQPKMNLHCRITYTRILSHLRRVISIHTHNQYKRLGSFSSQQCSELAVCVSTQKLAGVAAILPKLMPGGYCQYKENIFDTKKTCFVSRRCLLPLPNQLKPAL